MTKHDTAHMKIGSRVILKSTTEANDMFPEKYTDPAMRSFESGSYGTVESLFPSGSGVVRFDDGKGLLVGNVSDKFLLDGEES